MKITSKSTVGKIIITLTVAICLLIILIGSWRLQQLHRLHEAPVTTESETVQSTTKPSTTEPTTAKSTTVPVTTTAVVTTKPTTTTVTTKALTTLATTKAKTPSTSNQNLGTYTITGYCPCQKCSDGWGNSTASGATARAGHTIATSAVFPFGTQLKIEGLGTYTVEDRGGAVTSNRIDIYFNTHSEAEAFGRQARTVTRVS